MTRNVKRAVWYVSLGMAMLCAARAEAQQAAAPLPAQIFTGKKAFISNASGESNLPPGSSELTYNQFYGAMKSWGRYELVSAPADADLVFEIRYEVTYGPVYVTDGNGGSGKFPQLRLSLVDTKTHVLLWAFSEPVVEIRKKATGLENFQAAMDALMVDIKKLAGQAATVKDGSK